MALRLSKEKTAHHPARERVFPWPRQDRAIDGIDQILRSAIRNLVSGQAPWPLFLHGAPGTGKTCAALCLLDHCQGEYFTVPMLCSRMNQAKQGGVQWSHEGRGGTWYEHDLWHIVSTAGLVVLDEVGCRERVSDAHYEAVKGVIDERHFRPLIAISNLPLADLGTFYDSRIVSRLASGTVIELGGKDQRIE